MKKVLIYSVLLIVGLLLSQTLPNLLGTGFGAATTAIELLTMLLLSFLMIHVGYEFEIDKSNVKAYALDYGVAATAAAFPWIFCALYFVFVLAPPEMWTSYKLWQNTLLESRFASPTSAGVLFSMLAAAGLGATWVFKKARVLAIFDDLDTVLLMIPLKMMIVGMRWQLVALVLVMFLLIGLGWRYLHVLRVPISWPWVMGYSAAITLACEAIYLASQAIDPRVPIHLEVLLPAFVLGCVLARPQDADPHRDDAVVGHEEGPESPTEQRVSTIVSACFMAMVGLSMPAILAGHAPEGSAATPVVLVATTNSTGADQGQTQALDVKAREYGVTPDVVKTHEQFPGWGMIAVHVLAITLLSNLGKMFPAFFYRGEASRRERLALSVGMFPRGEVGAGVLVISLSYGIGGTALTVAMLSLALNLVCTGFFILVVKRLLADVQAESPVRPSF